MPRLELLGRARLVGADGGSLPLGPRIAPLLTLIALGGVKDRAAAAAMLYPELDAADARRNLRQVLHRQRALLERLIDDDGERLLLRAGVAVDALAADGSGDGAARDGRPEPLLGAQRFDTVPPFQRWLDGERERRLAAWRDRLAALADADERAGQFDAALRRAEQLVRETPTSEAAHQRVMRLHYLCGDAAAALAAFDRCERNLKDELSARPGEETLALLARIEKGELPHAPAASNLATSVLRPPRLVGRDREWRELEDAWRCRAAAAVTGEAGLGKTRLLADFASSRGAQVQLLRISARPGDERLPHALIGRLLRGLLARRTAAVPEGVRQELARLLPELGATAAVTDAQGQARFVNAVDAIVGDAIGAGLDALVLDDLHFADEASLEIIEHLSLPGRLRMLLAFRDVVLGEAAARLVEAVVPDQAGRRIALAPLTRDGVHALVVSLQVDGLDADAWSDALYRRCGGNPLFLLETIKSMLAQGLGAALEPASLGAVQTGPGIGALIDKRVARLTPAAVRLARCAAVAGQDFSLELATEVLATPAIDLSDAWHELETAQILREGAFVHDLIHEAALASVPTLIARHLHAQIAGCLRARSAEPMRIASHAEAGGLAELAARSWRDAGELARHGGRFQVASGFFCHAAENFEQAGDLERAFECRCEEAEAQATHRNDAAADTLLARLDDLARTPKERIAAMRSRLHHIVRRGEYAGAIELGERLLALLREEPDPGVHLRVACSLAYAHVLHQRADAALAVLQPCELWVRSNGSAEERILYLRTRAQAVADVGSLQESIVDSEAALEVARTEKRNDDIAMCTADLGVAHYYTGDYRRALGCVRQTAALISENEAGHRSGNLMWAELAAGRFLVALGEFDAALALVEPLGPELESLGASFWKGIGDITMAIAMLHLGQFARAERLLAAENLKLSQYFIIMAYGVRCEIALATQRQRIASLAAGAVDVLAGCDDAHGRHSAAIWRSRMMPGEEALPMLRDTITWAAGRGANGLAMAAHVRASEVTRRLGGIDAAAAHARTALELAERHHCVAIYRAELWLEAHRSLAASGDDEAAQQALDAGLDWLRRSLTHVPSAFRPSFLERNATNAALIRLGRQRGTATLLG